MRALTKYFFNGLLVLVPLAATSYVVYLIFSKIDGVFRFPIPGLGLILTIAIVIAIGFIATNIVTKKLLSLIDGLFSRLPFVKLIYTSIKDLTNTFVGDKKGFTKPVAVSLIPGSSVKHLGFITRESMEAYGMKDMIAVYLPQSFNWGGNLILVSRDQVTPLSVVSGEMLAFVVSGGIVKETVKKI